MNQYVFAKTESPDGLRFEGGPLDGHVQAVPYPFPSVWRVPVAKIPRLMYPLTDAPEPPKPSDAQYGYADYHLCVVKNMETDEITKVFYKLASVPDWYKDANAKKDHA